MSEPQDSTRTGRAPRRRAGLFDIRVMIALLLGIYGVVLTVYGLAFTTQEDLAKTNGTNLNLWTGIALVIAAVIFIAWARLRPVMVPMDQAAADRDTDATPPAH